jgi:hypothetical protein
MPRALHWSIWLAFGANVATTYANYLARNLLMFGVGIFTLGYLVGYGVFAWLQARRDRRREQSELDFWVRQMSEKVEREILRSSDDAL